MHRKMLATLTLVLTCLSCAVGQQPPPPSAISQVTQELQQRQFAAAKQHADAQLASYPKDVKLLTLKGMAEVGLGNLSAAHAGYNAALRLDGSYLPALEGAAQLAFQEHSKDAEGLLQLVLKQRPNDESAHALLGSLAYRSGSCASAIEHFQRSEERISVEPDLLMEQAICLSKTGRDEDAIPIFKGLAIQFPERQDIRFDLALAQANDNKTDEAFITLQPLMSGSSEDVEASTLAAELFEARQQTQEAINLLRKVLTRNPDYIEGYLEFAQICYAHSSASVGVDILNVGIGKNPQQPRLYLARGVLRTQMRDFIGAGNDFDVATRLDPNVQFVDDARGLIESQRYKPSEALEMYRKAVALHPDDGYAHYLLADALRNTRPGIHTAAFTEEMNSALEAVTREPRSSQMHDLLGQIELDAGMTVEALAQARISVQLDPSNQQALYHLIILLRKNKSLDDTYPLFQRLAELRTHGDKRDPGQSPFRLTEADHY